MTVWYYSDAQRNRLGPVAADDLARLHDGGQLAPEVLVWREGLPDWRPWREVMDEVLGRAPQAAAPAAFAIDGPAGASGNPYEIVERASPYAAPAAAVDAVADYRAGGDVVYAGFWKRVAASVIDGVVTGIGGFVIQMIVMAVFFGGVAAMSQDPSEMFASGIGIAGIVLIYALPLVLGIVYSAAFHASSHQATLGKMAVGIKVTDDAGRRISFWHGVGRYLAYIVASLPLAIGLVMAAFTERKRGLHDMMASTLVVDRWAFTSHPERQRRELGTVTVVILALLGLIVLGYVVLIGIVFAAIGMSAASG